MPEFTSEQEFHEWAEQRATAWRKRYGIGPVDAISDEKIATMLADHGYPELETLPDGPRGNIFPVQDFSAQTARGRYLWQRTNAMHLIGHVMMEHPDKRCDGCRDW